jgi:CBS domain-containing protein
MQFGIPTPKPTAARDLMTRDIITVAAGDAIASLLASMKDLAIRHLPVVDGTRLVGLVSERDLLHAASSFFSDKRTERDALIGTAKVETIMQKELLTVGPDDALSEVATLMFEAKVGCLPVVDETGSLLGVITEADFIRLAGFLLAQSSL